MKLIPAMSIKGGRVAIAEGGRYSYVRNPEGQFRAPANVLRDANFPGEDVFILDLDGLERNSPDLETVKRIASFRDVWLDAGTADSDSMMDLFVSDVSKVVMGTLSLASLNELADALDMSENVVFSLAWDGAAVSPDPAVSGKAMDAVLAEVGKLSIREAILFDLGSIRGNAAVDPANVSRMAGAFERVYVSGHIAEVDLKPLEDAGAAGAIVDFRTLEAMLHGRT